MDLDLKSAFQKLASNNNIFHSYIFFGNDIDCQLSFVLCLANFLENKNWHISSKPLIDCLLIEFGKEESIGIDEVRNMKNFLWQRPFISLRKTLIIKNADQLTTIGQNALLKIIEEPPSSGLIILITKDQNSLISTLLSRFQKVYIASSPTDGKIESSLLIGVKNFLKGSEREKINIIKKVIEDNILNDFITVVFSELDKDPIKNFHSLKELMYRWVNINKYNTNKKLQFEAWIRSSQL